MIDNKRFLHGRKQLSPVEGRDIVILQTKTTNFGYGVSITKTYKNAFKLGFFKLKISFFQFSLVFSYILQT